MKTNYKIFSPFCNSYVFYLYFYNVKQNEKQSIMNSLFNTTGSKAVKITIDATNTVHAMYIQIYNNEEQVLQSKSFASIKNAKKWASKILN